MSLNLAGCDLFPPTTNFLVVKMFRIKSPTRIENAPASMPTKCVSEERVTARTYDCYAITTICYIIRYGKSPFNSFLFSKIMEIFIFPFFGIT